MRTREEVKQDVIDDISPGCHFFEAGRFFFEVCPMDVFVTHESGACMVFSIDRVETKQLEHSKIEEHKWGEWDERFVERKVCESLLPKLGNITVGSKTIPSMKDKKDGRVLLIKLAAKDSYADLKAGIDACSNKYLQKAMKTRYDEVKEGYIKHYKEKYKEDLAKNSYWKQYAYWKTDIAGEELRYMYGNGTTKEYSVGELEGDVKTKLETVMCFLDDQSTFIRFDKFSNKGAQEFMQEFGYGCSCDEDFNIFDIKESFEKTDKLITIPVEEYEEHISAWVSNGIGEGDLELLAEGKLPDGYE